MENATPHSLGIEQCRKITATAIESVDSFSDKQIIMSYSAGRIAVAGNGMKIINFSKKLRLLSYIIEAAYGIMTAIKPALGKWRG